MTSRRQDAEAKFAAAATRDTDRSLSRRNLLLAGTTFAAGSAMASALTTSTAQAQQQPAPAAGRQPNILVIWGDDIGIWNISHNNRGMMGYMTPNIDRIAAKVCRSPTTTVSKAAPPAARPSSAAMCPCAPA